MPTRQRRLVQPFEQHWRHVYPSFPATKQVSYQKTRNEVNSFQQPVSPFFFWECRTGVYHTCVPFSSVSTQYTLRFINFREKSAYVCCIVAGLYILTTFLPIFFSLPASVDPNSRTAANMTTSTNSLAKFIVRFYFRENGWNGYYPPYG